MDNKMKENARERLIKSAKKLFAEKGVQGTSIREICGDAEVGINMIHHYFGNKNGLVDTVLDEFHNMLSQPLFRLLSDGPDDENDFKVKFKLYFKETLEVLAENKELFEILFTEILRMNPEEQATRYEETNSYQDIFIHFLEEGKKKKIVRQSLDIEMISGLLFDRVINQVRFASLIQYQQNGGSLDNPKYKKRWIDANVDLLLHGIMENYKS